jgi:TolB-like protein
MLRVPAAVLGSGLKNCWNFPESAFRLPDVPFERYIAVSEERVIYQFENYSLDVDRQELWRGADLVNVGPQVFSLLQFLIRNRDRVVSKDDLIEYVWNGRIVSDSTLTSTITIVRQAINDSGAAQRLIRTVARKGVRFVGDVRECRSDGWPARQSKGEAENPVLDARTDLPPSLPDKPSIAVLPFTNMSSDLRQEYFSDGITEDIITALSRLRWFFVIGRNSTFVYKEQTADVRKIGRDLGVRYILEGSVRKSGKRMRITAQLLDAATGNHLWAERYDRDLTDIFSLQDEITANVTAAIEPKLVIAEAIRMGTRTVDSLDAWGSIARAMNHFWKLTAVDSDAAIAILDKAVERHPNYAPAHSLLAFALLVAAHMGWLASGADKAHVARLASRALELDESDPWAHMALGYLAFSGRRTGEAVYHFRAAIDLNPNFAVAYGYAGWALSHDGQTDEAIKYLQQAMRMSPRDPFNVFYMAGLAAAHYLDRRYLEAAEWARRALQLRPGHLGARRKLCASLAQAGLIDDAHAALKELRQMQPNLSIAWIEQSVPYTREPMAHFLEGVRKAGLTN